MDITEQQKRESLDYLISIKMFLPYSGLKLYHGRTSKRDNGVEWQVNPRFNNSDNSTGNRNVNAVSALSTGDYETASDFAKERNRDAYLYSGKPIDTSTSRVYRIISTDKNALIYNLRFDITKLSSEDRVKCERALKILNESSLSELSPVKFEYRELYIDVYKEITTETFRRNQEYVSYDALSSVKKRLIERGINVNDEILIHVGGAINSRNLLRRNPGIVVRKYVIEKNQNKRTSMAGLIEGFDGPVSMEYFASWAHKNHLIGCKVAVDSFTLDREIDNYMIFDMTKINTEKAVGDKLHEVISRYGEISRDLANFSGDLELVRELENASPREAIEVLKRRGFEEPFKLSSGVWEKFSVGEHTETTLRVFEDSFGDDMPENLKPFMRFVLLSHDIGKGYSFRNHGKNKTMERAYTKDFCEKYLFKACKIDPKVQNLILFVIGESQNYIDKIYINELSRLQSKEGISNLKNQMRSRCQQILKELLGREPTRDEIRGLIGICKTVLTCDGGAYSRYAVTRDEKTGMYYRNGNDRFTGSFDKPSDTRGREIKFPELS